MNELQAAIEAAGLPAPEHWSSKTECRWDVIAVWRRDDQQWEVLDIQSGRTTLHGTPVEAVDAVANLLANPTPEWDVFGPAVVDWLKRCKYEGLPECWKYGNVAPSESENDPVRYVSHR